MSALPQTPTPAALSLPRLTRNEALARTTVAQCAVNLPVPLDGVSWLADLVPVTHSELQLAAGYVIRMEWAGAAFALCLPSAAVDQQVSAALGGASLPQIPASMADAAMEAACEPLMRALEALGRGAPALLSCQPSDNDRHPLPPHAFELSLRADAGSQAIAGMLYVDGLGLLLIAGLLKGRSRAASSVLPDLPLRLHVELGFTRMATDEVRSLAHGDVVLMDRFFATAARVLWLTADGEGGIHVQLPAFNDGAAHAAAHLNVLQPWTQHMPSEIDSSAATAPQAEAAPTLQSLPVRLSFDLGDVGMTLAQVQSLVPGQTIDLGHPVGGAVRVRANGLLIGEGDLVEIDGHVGVSISRIFDQSR